MLNRVHHLHRSTVTATDGGIGHVADVFFDDIKWTIRYLVVDTGKWLAGREVLISPHVVKPLVPTVKNIDVRLTRRQVVDSLGVDTHMPVSRQHETDVVACYGHPEPWGARGSLALGGDHHFSAGPPTDEELAIDKAARAAHIASSGKLQSAAHVKGYVIHATDGTLGHVSDFLFDDETWAIRHLVVETRNGWPRGKNVLIGVHWIRKIDWGNQCVHVKITLAQVKSSPKYDVSSPVHRDYEVRLHSAYDRTGHWD